MFGWLKPKPQVYLFKVTYSTSAMIDLEKKEVTFSMNNMQEIYIAAIDAADAYVQFAKRMAIQPHFYIHRIVKAGTCQDDDDQVG